MQNNYEIVSTTNQVSNTSNNEIYGLIKKSLLNVREDMQDNPYRGSFKSASGRWI